MNFRSGQDKDGVRWRFFQGLQQRIEGRRRQHMHFINNIDLEATFVGDEINTVAQVAYIIDTRIGGRVNFYEV